MAEDPGVDYPDEASDLIAEPSLGQQTGSQSPALSLEEARSRIAPEALKVLEAKFNGSLAEVRGIDDNDQFL